MMTSRSPVLSQAIGLFFVFATGPSAPADEMSSTAVGQVTVNGKPLASGRIFFYFDDDQFVGSKIKDGAYKVGRVPHGVWGITFDGEGVPARCTATTRGLCTITVNVERSENIFDFDLKSP